MSKELEAKILDVDPASMRQRLLALGAVPVGSLTKQSRYVFDIDPADSSKWIRLRTIGERTTLAVKHIHDDGIKGTEEYETPVNDADETLKMLEVMRFTPKAYQENYRESFDWRDAEISIDYWPQLEPYVEVEGSSEAQVVELVELLNPEGREVTSENTTELYRRRGIDLNQIARLVFTQDEIARLGVDVDATH